MNDVDPALDHLWYYRFTRPDGTEIEVQELAGDKTASAWAHDLSRSSGAAVVIHRNEGGDDWTYVTEVDDPP